MLLETVCPIDLVISFIIALFLFFKLIEWINRNY